MPLFWFDEEDVGSHGHGEKTLMSYLDEIGADDIADDIAMADGTSDLRKSMVKGLQALQDVTKCDFEWMIKGGKLVLK